MPQEFINEEVTMEDFKWDSEEDNFEVEGVTTVKSTETTSDKENKAVEKAETERLKIEAEEAADNKAAEEADFFQEGDDDEDEPKKDKKVDDEVITTEDDEAEIYTTLANELKEKGIFQHVELKEGEKLKADTFFDLHAQEIEAGINEGFEGFFEELKNDKDAIDFINHKRNGGSTQEFLEVYGTASEIPEIDIDDKKTHEPFLEYYFREVEGLDREETSDKIEWLKERGKISTQAEKLYPKLVQEAEKEKEALLERQKEVKNKQELANKKYVTEVAETLSKVEKVNDFTFTSQDKKELGGYITNPTVKVGKNQFVTAFHKDLQELIASKDKTKLLLLAKLLKTDFDTKDVIKNVTTKVTKETKSKLADIKLNVKTSSSNRPKKTLADFIS